MACFFFAVRSDLILEFKDRLAFKTLFKKCIACMFVCMRRLGPPEVELQTLVSCHMVLRIKPESSGKSVGACKPGVMSSASLLLYGSQEHRVGEEKALRPTSSTHGIPGQPGLQWDWIKINF